MAVGFQVHCGNEVGSAEKAEARGWKDKFESDANRDNFP